MKIAAILAFIGMMQPSFAGTPLVPPGQYDHQFSGALIVHEVLRDNVRAECGSEHRLDVAGCAYPGEGTCTIYLAMKTKRAPIKAILRHEIAHCNGWAFDHPTN